jgi:2-polyprenyl-3-methyl-5-hydroxy-6-metoxy-1,4-benzoquinol methylase
MAVDDSACWGIDDSWSFYEAIAAVYDQSGQSRFSLRMTAYLLECMAVHRMAPRRVLDLACGTGAAAVALARRRFELSGVDASPAMLERARARARRWGVTVEWHNRLMTDPAPLGCFDLVTCYFDSVNHLVNVKDVQALFEAVRAQLRVGGVFFFDVNTSYALAQVWGRSQDSYLADDYARIWQTQYEPATGLAHLEATYFIREAGGSSHRRVTVRHQARGYDAEAIASWLDAAGFDLIAAYPCFSFGKLGPHTERIAYWAVARAGSTDEPVRVQAR